MTRSRRPAILRSKTYRLDTEYGKLYVTVSLDENNQPFEVLGSLGKGGSFQYGVTELTCRLISLHLQTGTSLNDIIEQCQDIQEMQPFYNQLDSGQNIKVRGLGDGIASILKLFCEDKNDSST